MGDGQTLQPEFLIRALSIWLHFICLSPLHFLFFQEFPPAAKLSKFSVMQTELVTVCGKPHSNKPLWAAYVAALASLGIATYRFCFSPRRTKGAKAE